MSDQASLDRSALLRAAAQIALLVAIAALQDPEIRRNVLWAIEWGVDRVRSLVSPAEDEPPAPDVSKMMSEARALTRGEISVDLPEEG